jgi:glycosyltransferase involved in cell wall biosynthesis
LISIVVITYQREAFLTLTIDSILKQTFQDFELIIVDDGSDGKTLETVKLFDDSRIKYINQGRIGNLSKLRNIGVRNSSGELIAFSDDDDIWYPERLQSQLKLMERFSLVCSNANVIDSKGKIVADRYFHDFKNDFNFNIEFLLSYGNCILTSTVLVKRALFEDENNYFDEVVHTNYCEDYELFIRQIEGKEFCFIDKPLVGKRLHASISRGLDNNIIMIGKSIEIIEQRIKTKSDPRLTNYGYEGIVGLKVELIKKCFSKSIFLGINNSGKFMIYVLKPGVFNVFLRRLIRKLKKMVNLVD